MDINEWLLEYSDSIYMYLFLFVKPFKHKHFASLTLFLSVQWFRLKENIYLHLVSRLLHTVW